MEKSYLGKLECIGIGDAPPPLYNANPTHKHVFFLSLNYPLAPLLKWITVWKSDKNTPRASLRSHNGLQKRSTTRVMDRKFASQNLTFCPLMRYLLQFTFLFYGSHNCPQIGFQNWQLLFTYVVHKEIMRFAFLLCGLHNRPQIGVQSVYFCGTQSNFAVRVPDLRLAELTAEWPSSWSTLLACFGTLRP